MKEEKNRDNSDGRNPESDSSIMLDVQEIIDNDLKECLEDRNTEEQLYGILDGIRGAFDVAATGLTEEGEDEDVADLTDESDDTIDGGMKHAYVVLMTETLYAAGGIGLPLLKYAKGLMQKVTDVEEIESSINSIKVLQKITPESDIYDDIERAKRRHRSYRENLNKNLYSYKIYRTISTCMSLITIGMLAYDLDHNKENHTLAFILTGINIAFSRLIAQLTQAKLQKISVQLEARIATNGEQLKIKFNEAMTANKEGLKDKEVSRNSNRYSLFKDSHNIEGSKKEAETGLEDSEISELSPPSNQSA